MRGEVAHRRGLRCGAGGGTQHGHCDATLAQRGGLLCHQRDQRRDHHGDAVRDERRQLEADGLAAARGHEHERIAAAEHTADHAELRRAERAVAERAEEHRLEGLGGRRRREQSRRRRGRRLRNGALLRGGRRALAGFAAGACRCVLEHAARARPRCRQRDFDDFPLLRDNGRLVPFEHGFPRRGQVRHVRVRNKVDRLPLLSRKSDFQLTSISTTEGNRNQHSYSINERAMMKFLSIFLALLATVAVADVKVTASSGTSLELKASWTVPSSDIRLQQ